MARFKRIGTPLAMVDDTWSKIGITGPEWIKDKLSFTPAGGVVNVAAPTFGCANKKLGDVPYVETARAATAQRAAARRSALTAAPFAPAGGLPLLQAALARTRPGVDLHRRPAAARAHRLSAERPGSQTTIYIDGLRPPA